MRLAHPWSAFLDDLTGLADGIAPFDLPPLQVADLGPFLALRETAPCPPLNALADACVTGMDAHRLPADAAEIARRRRSTLSPEQDRMLLDWGYPHVLETWRFHMTLTRRLSPDERAVMQPAAMAHFAAALTRKRHVTDICVFTQNAPGRRFHACRACSAARLSIGDEFRRPLLHRADVDDRVPLHRQRQDDRPGEAANQVVGILPPAFGDPARAEIMGCRDLHHMHAKPLRQLRDRGAGDVGHHHAPVLQIAGDTAG